MAVNITIKGIPDEIYRKLKSQAGKHHRSINSEVIMQLTKAVRSNKTDPERMIERIRQLKQRTKGSLRLEEVQHAIDRDRP